VDNPPTIHGGPQIPISHLRQVSHFVYVMQQIQLHVTFKDHVATELCFRCITHKLKATYSHINITIIIKIRII
jgi:hypothetical protein